MKNAYYVYLVDEKGCNAWQEGKYDDLEEARRDANDTEYRRRRDKQPGSVEIRQYTHDIEDEDCECFDYNTFPFAEQTITTIDTNYNKIYDALQELEKKALDGSGLYYSLYMSEDGSLYTGEEANADTEPEAVWSGKDICLHQAHYSKSDLDSEIMNIVEHCYGDMITALKAHLTDKQCAPGIIDDGIEYADNLSQKSSTLILNARESLEDECKEAILDSTDFNDIIDWKVKEIRDSE